MKRKIAAGVAALAIAGAVFGVSSGGSGPEAVAKTFKAAIVKQRFGDITPLLSPVGKKRVRELAFYQLRQRQNRHALATLIGKTDEQLENWTVLDLLDALVQARDRLITNGVDLGLNFDADQWKQVAAQMKIGTPAVDGKRASVPLTNLDGQSFLLDMELVGDAWKISHLREVNDPPLWETGAELNYVKLEKRAASSEAKANLKQLMLDQRNYSDEAGRRRRPEGYGATFDAIGFNPESGNGYTYFAADIGPMAHRPGDGPAPKGVVVIGYDQDRYLAPPPPSSYSATGCPLTLTPTDTEYRRGPKEPKGLGLAEPYVFVGAAAANLDEDADFDCWSVATFNRVSASGEVIYSNQPFHEQQD